MSKKHSWQITRFFQDQEDREQLNIWQPFTSLIANAFLIVSLLFLLTSIESTLLKSLADKNNVNLGLAANQAKIFEGQKDVLKKQLRDSQSEVKQLSETNHDLQQVVLQKNHKINLLESQLKNLNRDLPVVVIQNSGNFKFARGSAELPKELRNYITTQLVDKIEKISQKDNLYRVEIIGYTDGLINLDPSNYNVDLGLLRALEIIKQLQIIQQTGRLKNIEFRAYSGAQLLLPSDILASVKDGVDLTQRRIELRFSSPYKLKHNSQAK